MAVAVTLAVSPCSTSPRGNRDGNVHGDRQYRGRDRHCERYCRSRRRELPGHHDHHDSGHSRG
jgi:hypothetical protein